MSPIDVEEYAKEGLDEEEAESRLAVFITEVGGEPEDFEENKETWEESPPWEEEEEVKLLAREAEEVDGGGII